MFVSHQLRAQSTVQAKIVKTYYFDDPLMTLNTLELVHYCDFQSNPINFDASLKSAHYMFT